MTRLNPKDLYMKKILYLFVIGSVLIGCSSTDIDTPALEEAPDLTQLYFPPIATSEWETVTLDQLAWNPDATEPLLDFLASRNSKAFLILQNGRIAMEAYFNGGDANTNYPWFSAGKTLTAFTLGIAIEEGYLNVEDSSADYLGEGWTLMPFEQEQNITVRDHITMTTGLDYTVANVNCTDPECLDYYNEPGSFWYYHNAPYTLSQDIISGAIEGNFENYFNAKVKSPIGMQGDWVRLGFPNVYYSTARSMARFGLLSLNSGIWDGESLLSDQTYLNALTSPSQDLNPAYGYLWWLNGQDRFRVPSSELEFQGALIPNAPSDLVAGLGAFDQKLYVVPSLHLVVIRLGDSAGEDFLGPSSFDNQLWGYLQDLINY